MGHIWLKLHIVSHCALRASLGIIMFEPVGITSVAPANGKKRRGEDGVAEMSGSGAPLTSKRDQELLKAVAEATLMLDRFRCEEVRSANIVIKALSSSGFAVGMESSLATYEEAGKKARADVDEEEYRGNPYGKRPDAMIKAVVVRLSQQLAVNEVVAKISQLDASIKTVTEAAASRLLEDGNEAQSPSSTLKGKRCFRVNLSDEHSVKWIFSAVRNERIMEDIRVLGQSRILEQSGIEIMEDHAPMSASARKIQALLHGKGGNGRAKFGGG